MAPVVGVPNKKRTTMREATIAAALACSLTFSASMAAQAQRR
jgi:uncharacterized membrane protein